MDEKLYSLFAVIRAYEENDKSLFVGNGFFLTEKGIAVSASHVFEDSIDPINTIPAFSGLIPPEFREKNRLIVIQLNNNNTICHRPLMRVHGLEPETYKHQDICIGIPSMAFLGKPFPPIKHRYSVTAQLPNPGDQIHTKYLSYISRLKT